MSNPTFIWHVTMAVHDDRVRAMQQSDRDRSCISSSPVHRPLGLARRLACRLQLGPARHAGRDLCDDRLAPVALKHGA